MNNLRKVGQYICCKNAADCCRLLQIAADCCILLQIAAGCCRLLQIVSRLL